MIIGLLAGKAFVGKKVKVRASFAISDQCHIPTTIACIIDKEISPAIATDI